MPEAFSNYDGLIGVVNARKQHTVNYHQKYFLKLARWYDLWRGLYAGRFATFRNNVHLPLLFSIVQSDVARKAQTSFGTWPIVGFSGYAPEDAGRARKNEILVSAQMKEARSFEKAVDFFTTADLYGTAVARLGWRTDHRKEQWRVLNESTNHEELFTGMVTKFDGPDWEVIDPLDFWPQPGRARIAEMDWCIHRYYLDLDVIREMAQQGHFDKGAVNDLASAPIQGMATAEMQQRVSVYRSFGEWEARQQERFARPIEIWDMWGRLPREFAPDGIVHRLVSLGNGRVVLRNRPNPFWHGRLPFYDYSPCPDPHYFHGVGKVEIGEKMQATASRIASQKLDAVDVFMDPVFLVDESLGLDTSNLYMKAGRIIRTAQAPTPDRIRPLSPDLRGLQQAYPEIAQLWSMIQQGTGLVEDVALGGPGSSRQTAREFLGRQESVLTRLMLEARLAEEGFLEPLANGFVDNNKQYLRVPHEVKILGSAALVNPITGLPYPPRPVRIELEDINHNYRAHAIGASQLLSKNAKVQNLLMALQASSSNPVAIRVVNWSNFFRQLFQALDLTNLDELLVTQVPAINQIAETNGASPGAVAGIAQQPLEQLNPDQLGTLFGQNPAPLPDMGPLQAAQL